MPTKYETKFKTRIILYYNTDITVLKIYIL